MAETYFNKARGNLSLIPQIFYDIIARIIPGMIIIILGYLLLLGNSLSWNNLVPRLENAWHWFSSKETPYIFAFFNFILSAYVITTILSQFPIAIEQIPAIRKRRNRQFENLKKEISREFNDHFPKAFTTDLFPSIAIMYDFVRLYEPAAGARLVKLRAEFHMCKNLASGLLLLAFILLIKTAILHHDLLAFLISVFISCVAIILLIICYIRRQLFLHGLCNHWFLLKGFNHF